jgi:polyhydroxyalkanoate synthase subunit PhaE
MNDSKRATQESLSRQPMMEYWNTWYEKTCKPFFNIPQFGLTRYYQEHTYQSMDKYYQFQATLTELLDLLLKPVSKSLMDSQKIVFEAAAEKKEIKEPKDLYTRWLSILEKQFMELFQSPDYTHCLSKTMASFNEFIISRQTVIEDALKVLPIPTHSEMDGLYKEIYELKKRVRDLEKEQVMH